MDVGSKKTYFTLFRGSEISCLGNNMDKQIVFIQVGKCIIINLARKNFRHFWEGASTDIN